MKFVINPGHGGSDPGAVGNGLREKDINLAVALAMVPLLTARGIDVSLTRTGDIYRSLQQRSQFMIDIGADAALDLHHNGFGDPAARGIETFRSRFNLGSRTLAEELHPQLIAALGMPDRGIKTRLYPNRTDWDYYHMIREPHRQAGIPVALTEAGFITSPADAAIMKRADFATMEAEALARGICGYFGIPWTNGSSDDTQIQRIIDVYVNGKKSDVTGYLINNVTHVPVTFAANLAGGEVSGHGDYVRISIDNIEKLKDKIEESSTRLVGAKQKIDEAVKILQGKH